jgi:Esterase-like activity of phytase
MVLIAGLEGSASPTPPPGFLNTWAWSMEDPRFGGLSGLEIAENGLDFILLSDRGAITSGQLSRDAQGHITAVSAQPFQLLKAHGAAALQAARADSEGLALAPDGSVCRLKVLRACCTTRAWAGQPKTCLSRPIFAACN